MADKSRIQHVIQKYRLFEPAVVTMNGLGRGPVMSDRALEEFVRRDPSGNGKYLDWMLFIAGGGQSLLDHVLAMWEGQGPKDDDALRNQMRKDFIEERTGGYTDPNGTTHPPVSLQEACKMWDAMEPRYRFEFLVGDQDIASEEGYGFYREWPGKDGIYEKVCTAINLWHKSLPKLKAAGAELDIYAGWRPNQLSQSKAVYKNLTDLLHSMADIRKQIVLHDVRVEIVYEDETVIALCPLTVGASLKHGSPKWCTANRSDFDRSFGDRPLGSWMSYTRRGPLVYLTWKCAMPAHQTKMALHIPKERMASLREPWDMLQFFDAENDPHGVTYADIRSRMNRSLAASLDSVLEAVRRWAANFDCYRVVSDFTTVTTLSDKG